MNVIKDMFYSMVLIYVRENVWVSDKESSKRKASEQELSLYFQHWPDNPSILHSWQVNFNWEIGVSGLMTPVIEVLQLLPPVLNPCSPGKLLIMIYLPMLLGACILLLT